jgi:hypothetical protein
MDLSKSLPEQARLFPPKHVRGKKKRKRHVFEIQPTANSNNCTVCLRYNGMLYMDFIDANEMLVVEQPWLGVVSSFPAALERKVYGT